MADLRLEVGIDLSRLNRRDLERVSRQVDRALSGRTLRFNVDGNAQNSLKKIDKNLKSVKKNATEASHSMITFGEEAAFAVRRFGAFTVAVGAFRSLSGSIKATAKESFLFERELVKIGQVSNRTLNQLTPLRDEVLRLASSYGVSSQKILESARTLTQAGISAVNVKKALDALSKTEIAPTFGDMTQTTEAAIAIFRQFGTGAEKLESQLDSINSVASKFAVESNDIVQVIRKAGGIFKSSGGSLEELISLFTTVRSTTRESADSIATGLRTIFVRLQRPELINQLEELGITLRDSNNLFIGPYQALEAISQKLSQLNPQSEVVAKITEALGGFRQVSRVIPLIQNFGEANKALNVALSSQGSLLNDVSQAQESVLVKYEQLRQKFFKLVSDIQSDDTLKGLALDLIKVAKAAVDVADSIRPLIPLIAAIASTRFAIGAAGFATGFIKKTKQFAIPKNNGGLIPGRGPNKDSVLTYLTKGEFVLQRDAVDAIGVKKLEALNNVKRANTGGLIGLNSGGPVQRLNAGGGVGAAATGLIAGSIILKLNSTSKEADGASDSLKSFNDSVSASAASLGLLLYGVSSLLPVLNGFKESLSKKLPNIGNAFPGTKSLFGSAAKYNNTSAKVTASVIPSLNNNRSSVVNRLNKVRGYERISESADRRVNVNLDKRRDVDEKLKSNRASIEDSVRVVEYSKNRADSLRKKRERLERQASTTREAGLYTQNEAIYTSSKIKQVKDVKYRAVAELQKRGGSLSGKSPGVINKETIFLTQLIEKLSKSEKKLSSQLSVLNSRTKNASAQFDFLQKEISETSKAASNASKDYTNVRKNERRRQSRLGSERVGLLNERELLTGRIKRGRKTRRFFAGKAARGRDLLSRSVGRIGRVKGVAKLGKIGSKIGRAGAKLATSGVGGAIASLLAEPVLGLIGNAIGGTEGGKAAQKNFGGLVGGAGTGAAIGSLLGPIGTLVGGGVGALVGGIPALAKNFEVARIAVDALTFGMVKFTSAAQDANNENLDKKIEADSKELEKVIKNLNKVKVGATVEEQSKLNQKSVKDLFSKSLNVIKTKREIFASDLSSEQEKGLLAKNQVNVDAFSPKIIEEFDKIAKANPGESLTKLASRLGNTQDVLKVLDVALKSAGIKLDDYAKQIKNSNKDFAKINEAQAAYLAALGERTQITSALEGASFVRDASVNTVKRAAGNFVQNDFTSLFSRAAAGTIQQRDTVSSKALDVSLKNIAGFGGVAEPVAQKAATEAIIARALPDIVRANSVNKKGSSVKIFQQLSDLVRNKAGGKELVSEIKASFDKAFTGDAGAITNASGADVEAFLKNRFTKSLDVLKDFQKALQEQNGKLQEAYNTRIGIENQLRDRISKVRDAQINASDNILKYGLGRGLNIKEADFRDKVRLNDTLRGTGLNGNATLSQLRDKLKQSTINRNLANENQDVASFNKFNQEVNSVTRALEMMRDSSEKASVIQNKLNDIQERQAGGRGLIEKFLTGSKEDKKSLQKDIDNAQKLLSGGTLSGEDLKGGLDTVRTLQGDEVANKILARLAGVDGAEFFKPVGQTVQGKPLFNQLQQINKDQVNAGGILAGNSQQTLDVMNDFIRKMASDFNETLRELLKRPGGIDGQQAQNTISTIQGELTHNVNINLNGAEVMKGLEPSIQAIVVSTTNKIVAESFKANGMNAPADVQLGTAGKV